MNDFEHLMSLARLGPGWIAHVRHEAKESDEFGKLNHEWGWYVDLGARIEAAMDAEGLINQRKVTNERQNQEGKKRAISLAREIRQQPNYRDRR